MVGAATYVPITNRQRGVVLALIALLYLVILLVFFMARMTAASRPVAPTRVVLPLIRPPVPLIERQLRDGRQSPPPGAAAEAAPSEPAPARVPAPLPPQMPVQVDQSTVLAPDLTPMPAAAPVLAASAPASSGNGGEGTNGQAGAGSGGSGGATGPGTGGLVRADWAKEPSWEEVYAFHPLRARRAKQSGSATLKCQVRLTRKLQSCQIMSDTPAGWSFGTAALRLAPRLRVFPRKLGGVEMDDGWVFFTVRFDLPPEPAR